MLRDRVLEVLFDNEITQKELTSRLGSSRSRISEVLMRLEKEGLILRKKVSQRTVLVSLNHSRTLRVGILRSSEYVHVLSTLSELSEKIPFRVRVYENSLEALKELVTGSEDIVASPLISGYFFFIIDKNVRPIAGVARGGAGMLKRRERGKIGTTPLSRMDRDSRESVNYERVYFKGIEDILKAYMKGEIDAAQIWEPFLSMNGGTSSPAEGMCCCLFAFGKPKRSVNLFLSRYLSNVEAGLKGSRRREVSDIASKFLGVGTDDISASLESYSFTASIGRRDLMSQIETFGLPVVREVDLFLERCPRVSV